MRPMVTPVLTTTAEESVPFVLDYMQSNFKVGFGCVITGSISYTVQHSFQLPSDPNAVWFDNASVVTSAANESGNYAFPIRSIKLLVDSSTGGTVQMTVLQGNGD